MLKKGSAGKRGASTSVDGNADQVKSLPLLRPSDLLLGVDVLIWLLLMASGLLRYRYVLRPVRCSSRWTAGVAPVMTSRCPHPARRLCAQTRTDRPAQSMKPRPDRSTTRSRGCFSRALLMAPCRWSRLDASSSPCNRSTDRWPSWSVRTVRCAAGFIGRAAGKGGVPLEPNSSRSRIRCATDHHLRRCDPRTHGGTGARVYRAVRRPANSRAVRRAGYALGLGPGLGRPVRPRSEG